MKTFFFCLFFIITIPLFSQNSQANFGEGVVSIKCFAFPPGETFVEWPVEPAKYNPLFRFTYYIKDNKVLRQEEAAARPIGDTSYATHGIQNSIALQMLEPKYLIDLKTKTAYKFITDSNKVRVSAIPLKDFSEDMFFRIDRSALKIINTDEKDVKYIAGLKCYKGEVLAGKLVLPFYFTREVMKVSSPLNNFAPFNFPYNILSVKLPVNWSGKDGQELESKGVLVPQVVDIEEKNIEDSIFIVHNVFF